MLENCSVLLDSAQSAVCPCDKSSGQLLGVKTGVNTNFSEILRGLKRDRRKKRIFWRQLIPTKNHPRLIVD